MTLFQENIPINSFSTFRVGGYAKNFVTIEKKEDFKEAFEKFKNPFFLGGGSNILFPDTLFEKPIFHIKNIQILHHGNGLFEIGSGALMAKIYQITKKEGYDFAIFSTIPGTIGGATYGNAGLPAKEIKDVFIKALLYDQEEKEFIEVSHDFFEFSYRSSKLHHTSGRYLIWKVWIQLEQDEPQNIQQKAKQYMDNRKTKQPWGLTGGSFFKNPEKYAAGYLLEQIGAKEMKEGDAHFSQKHANFMMNGGSATQQDIITLAKKAAKKVQQEFDITLVPEVRILDTHGNVIPFTL